MLGNDRVVVLIPARGGSKGIRRKNLVTVGGVSLLQRAIDCATGCHLVDDIILSTDDDEIAKVASLSRVLVHRRSHVAAQDTSTADQVVIDLIDSGVLTSYGPNVLLVYLQPTSPLRTSRHLKEALEAMMSRGMRTCVSVVSSEHPPQKSVEISQDGTVCPIFDEHSVTANRQSLPSTYRPNGAIYIFTLEQFLKNRKIPITGSHPYVMNSTESMDIDSNFDVRMAEFLLCEGWE